MVGNALFHAEFGKPLDVLSLAEKSFDGPAEGEVLIQMLASPINPSDFGRILGSYGHLPTLPAVPGREGIGEIVDIGPDVSHVKIGDRVRIPPAEGCWQSLLLAEAGLLQRVPSQLDPQQAAMSFINPPTALLLLKRTVTLQEGDWILQNAANSAVGISVIQLAKHLGFRTLNIVRREELKPELEALGADLVVTEESGYEKQVRELTGGEPIKLALNSVGGESAIRQLKALGDGSTQITFGGMSFEAVRFPTRYLIFNDIRLRGFWLDAWTKQQREETVEQLYNEVWELMDKGIIKLPISASYPIERYEEAIAEAQKPRFGKILFTNPA